MRHRNAAPPLTARRLTAALIAAAAAAAIAGGCSQQTIESATTDAAHNAQVIAREAHRAEQQARPQLKKLGLGGRVTAAIQANQNLPHTIRVDASETGVTLRGTVKTAAQRDLAGKIARQTLSEQYSVKNELKVEGE